ncbi:MAG: hypothetical protein M3322_03580 [Actinomycetota bacterium]|nr:hypothetical protein [Actinomycetota bacterium]
MTEERTGSPEREVEQTPPLEPPEPVIEERDDDSQTRRPGEHTLPVEPPELS